MSEHIQAHTEKVLQLIDAKAADLEKELVSILSSRAFDKQFRTRDYFLEQKNRGFLTQRIHIENRQTSMYTSPSRGNYMPEARKFCEQAEGHMISNVVSYHHRIKGNLHGLLIGGTRERYNGEGRSLIDIFMQEVTEKKQYLAKNGILLSEEVKKNISEIAIRYAILDMLDTANSLEKYGVETDDEGFVKSYYEDRLHEFVNHLDNFFIEKFEGISEENFLSILSYVYQTFLLHHYKDDESFRDLIESGDEQVIIDYIHGRYLK